MLLAGGGAGVSTGRGLRPGFARDSWLVSLGVVGRGVAVSLFGCGRSHVLVGVRREGVYLVVVKILLLGLIHADWMMVVGWEGTVLVGRDLRGSRGGAGVMIDLGWTGLRSAWMPCRGRP